MNTETLNTYVAAALARAPKITDQKRDELTRYLRSGSQRCNR